ncbi:MAG TPA: hypothetical protein EYN91_08215 [Candidatus Melainabacteria bacterium]|nr:hypothetical protein [Candidatus Melainabacteria bacterium]HIN66204.1 hypothetical protein [Candidatus Obscuribacterales bacterium]
MSSDLLVQLKNQIADPTRLSRPWRYLFFFVAILTLLLVHYYPFLFAGRTYVSSDHHLFFEPFCRYIGDAYAHWRLPLWNPFLYFGMPQFALPSPSFLYPPTLLYSVLTYSQGLSVQQILHHCVAAVGGCLLAESLGLSFGAAACAGLAFAFSGYMFTLSSNYSLVAGSSWLPMALFASRRIRFAQSISQRSQWIIVLSLCVFLMISAGRPEVFVPIMVIVLAHALTGFGRHYLLKFKTNWERKADAETSDPADQLHDEKPLKIFFCRVLALAIGGCLCMPLLLPALEWASTSNRAKGLDPNEVMIWSANWYSFATMVLAQPFGDLQTIGNGFLPVAADRASYMPFLPSAYVGSAVLTFAMLGVFHTRSPWLVPAGLLLIAGSVLSLGRYTPVMPWLLHTFPSLATSRYPVKLMVLPIMAICLLAAFGIQATKDNRVGYKALKGMAIFWFVVLLSGLLAVIFGRYWLTIQSAKMSINAEVTIAIGTAIFHSGAVGLTLVAICILRQKNLIENFGFLLFSSLLLVMDLLGTSMRFPALSAPSSFYTDKPVLMQMMERQVGETGIAKARLLSLYYDPLAAPASTFNGGPSERTLKYYRYCRDLLVCNSNMDYNVQQAYGYEGALSAKYRHLVLSLINDVRNATETRKDGTTAKVIDDDIYDEGLRRYSSAAGLQYVACQLRRDGKKQPDLSSDDFEIVEENDPKNIRLYKVKNPKPRIELVESWTWVDSTDQAYRILEVDESKEKGLSLMPLIERKKDENRPYPLGFVEKNTPRTAVCELLCDKPEHVVISVNSPKPGMLILRDQFYPGWKALLDSVSVPIYRANGFTRAVYVPAGAHAIEFNYKPDSLKYGVRIALVALAGLGVLAFLAFAPGVWRFVKWTAGQN